ncbi:hypothetical protein [Micromonospora aurantiaca (nom. illeg.)]|uniref:hypothetical protein n=1 Tax=Micromonospora aurantiaca (nom. illeg.) TaxID=47850 RepID=UPI0035B48E72
MPMDEGAVTPALVIWTAQRVVTQHHEPASEHRATGRCAQCRDDGCGMLEWARGVLKARRLAGNRAKV